MAGVASAPATRRRCVPSGRSRSSPTSAPSPSTPDPAPRPAAHAATSSGPVGTLIRSSVSRFSRVTACPGRRPPPTSHGQPSGRTRRHRPHRHPPAGQGTDLTSVAGASPLPTAVQYARPWCTTMSYCPPAKLTSPVLVVVSWRGGPRCASWPPQRRADRAVGPGHRLGPHQGVGADGEAVVLGRPSRSSPGAAPSGRRPATRTRRWDPSMPVASPTEAPVAGRRAGWYSDPSASTTGDPHRVRPRPARHGRRGRRDDERPLRQVGLPRLRQQEHPDDGDERGHEDGEPVEGPLRRRCAAARGPPRR